MYLALNASLTAKRVSWPRLAHLAARTGFPGVDIATTPAMNEGAQATRDLLRDLELQPAALGLPVEFRKDDAAFRADLEALEQAARFASAVGCPRMTTSVPPSSDTAKPELRKVYLDRFREIAGILARSRVRLGLEFLSPLHLRRRSPHEFIWRMDEMLAFAIECGPNVGLLLDSWHWHHAGATPADIRAAGRDRIVHVHLNDAADLPPEEVRDTERLMPGEGSIDLTGFLKALEATGYNDAVSVEVFGRGLAEMTPEEGAKMGLETARAVLDHARTASHRTK